MTSGPEHYSKATAFLRMAGHPDNVGSDRAAELIDMANAHALLAVAAAVSPKSDDPHRRSAEIAEWEKVCRSDR